MARVSFVDVKRVGIALGWVVLFGAIGIGVTIGLANALPGWGGRDWFVTRNGVYTVIGFGLATLVVGRWLNKYSWDGMGWRRGTAMTLLRGTGIGAAMAALAIGLAVVGGARLSFTSDWSVWAGVAVPLLIGLLLSALGEELGFRGYPMRRLADGIGVLPAMLLLALVFGLAHRGNPSATVFSTVNVALAAIWLTIAFFSSGGMPLAWGAHFGWNAGLALLFDAPVSGYTFQVPVVEYTAGARAWVDGAAFGPEGGIVATIALLAGTFYLLTRKAAFSDQPSAVSEPVPAA